MKILVAIESSKRAEEMAHTTLRWAARAGFNLRIFIPDNRQRKVYEKAVDDCNYHYYFNIPPTVLVAQNKEGTPMEYAKANGYDLLLHLPDNLLDYKSVRDDDKTFIEYAEDVAKARVQFGTKPELMELPLEQNNLCIMERVV
jgi:hypothetical protein